MRTSDANVSQPAHRCPLCNAPLQDPAECSRCDWTRGYRKRQAFPFNNRDLTAALLSVVPGLGHLFKGHQVMGTLLLLGTLLAVAVCAIIATFTAGFGLLLIPLYWAVVMCHAFLVADHNPPPAAHGEPGSQSGS